jgi:hypothetical protein
MTRLTVVQIKTVLACFPPNTTVCECIGPSDVFLGYPNVDDVRELGKRLLFSELVTWDREIDIGIGLADRPREEKKKQVEEIISLVRQAATNLEQLGVDTSEKDTYLRNWEASFR